MSTFLSEPLDGLQRWQSACESMRTTAHGTRAPLCVLRLHCTDAHCVMLLRARAVFMIILTLVMSQLLVNVRDLRAVACLFACTGADACTRRSPPLALRSSDMDVPCQGAQRAPSRGGALSGAAACASLRDQICTTFCDMTAIISPLQGANCCAELRLLLDSGPDGGACPPVGPCRGFEGDCGAIAQQFAQLPVLPDFPDGLADYACHQFPDDDAPVDSLIVRAVRLRDVRIHSVMR